MTSYPPPISPFPFRRKSNESKIVDFVNFSSMGIIKRFLKAIYWYGAQLSDEAPMRGRVNPHRRAYETNICKNGKYVREVVIQNEPHPFGKRRVCWQPEVDNTLPNPPPTPK